MTAAAVLAMATSGVPAASAAETSLQSWTATRQAYDVCQLLLGGDLTATACDQAASTPLGRFDDAGRLTSRLLLKTGGLTFVQWEPIQRSELRLRVLDGHARVLLHRVTEYWIPGWAGQRAPAYDPEPIASALPDADGNVVFDLTWVADAWQLFGRADGKEGGLWDTGLLVRLEQEAVTGGCAAHDCPGLQLASRRHPDPALRPSTFTTSWQQAPWTSKTHARPPAADGRAWLSTSTRWHSTATAARFQFQIGRDEWRDIPLAQLGDEDGAPLDAAERPLDRDASEDRWTAVSWDTTGLPDGRVRVRALHRAATYAFYDGGATTEANFVIDRIPDPEPEVEQPHEEQPPPAPGGEQHTPEPPTHPTPPPVAPTAVVAPTPVAAAPTAAPAPRAARRAAPSRTPSRRPAARAAKPRRAVRCVRARRPARRGARGRSTAAAKRCAVPRQTRSRRSAR